MSITRSSLLIVFIILQCVAFSQVLPGDKPDMVVEVFRHGARAPTELKFDPSWGAGGYLTSTGIRQVYTLGLMMGKKYDYLLDSYSPTTVHVRSSASQRAIMSASAHVFGAFQGKGPKLDTNNQKDHFLPPYQDDELTSKVQKELESVSESIPGGFQPTVLQYPPQQDDQMLFVGPWACAAMGGWQTARLDDEKNKGVYEYLGSTAAKLRALGYDINSIEEMKEFGDTLIDNTWDNRPLPKGVTIGDEVYNDALFAYEWFSNYNYVYDEGVERVVKSMGLIDQVNDWFKKKVEGTTQLKFSILSAHDTTLLPILGLYNITTPDCLLHNYKDKKAGKEIHHPDCKFPYFASNIIWELYNKPEGAYVKFLYNGKAFKICDNGTENGCLLEEFAKKSKELLMGYGIADFNKLCSADNNGVSTPDDGPSRVLLIVIVGACVLTALCFIFTDEKKEREEEKEDLYFLDNKNNIEMGLLTAKKESTKSPLDN